MSDNDHITRREYQAEVESTALTILDKFEEYPEDYDDISEVVFTDVDSHEYVKWNHNHLHVLRHSEIGPEEWQTYVEDGEENHHAVLQAMAYTAFRADVYEQIAAIREAREALGECFKMIDTDSPIYGEGVTFEYDYEKGYSDPEILTYTFECISEGEWRVYDPDGVSFEVISARVMVEHTDDVVPAKVFKNRLDNIIARREHERESEDNDE